jgi:hypothetical protein
MPTWTVTASPRTFNLPRNHEAPTFFLGVGPNQLPEIAIKFVQIPTPKRAYKSIFEGEIEAIPGLLPLIQRVFME